MRGTPQKPNPEKSGIYVPTRLAPKPAEIPEEGAAGGDIHPETQMEGEIPTPVEIPDPMIRRMPITGKELEIMDIQKDARGAILGN